MAKQDKNKKTTKVASANDAPEAKDPKQSEKAMAFNKPAFKPAGVCFDDGLLVQEHWDVPVVLHKDMHFDQPGVCVATKDTYENMVGILSGTPTKTAMLVPATLEVEATIIVAWVKIDGELRQTTRQLVHLGNTAVVYNPTAARGLGPATQQMSTIVIELPRRVFDDDKDWKLALTNCNENMNKMIKEQLTATQWNDLRIGKPTSRLYQT